MVNICPFFPLKECFFCLSPSVLFLILRVPQVKESVCVYYVWCFLFSIKRQDFQSAIKTQSKYIQSIHEQKDNCNLYSSLSLFQENEKGEGDSSFILQLAHTTPIWKSFFIVTSLHQLPSLSYSFVLRCVEYLHNHNGRCLNPLFPIFLSLFLFLLVRFYYLLMLCKSWCLACCNHRSLYWPQYRSLRESITKLNYFSEKWFTIWVEFEALLSVIGSYYCLNQLLTLYSMP